MGVDNSAKFCASTFVDVKAPSVPRPQCVTGRIRCRLEPCNHDAAEGERWVVGLQAERREPHRPQAGLIIRILSFFRLFFTGNVLFVGLRGRSVGGECRGGDICAGAAGVAGRTGAACGVTVLFPSSPFPLSPFPDVDKKRIAFLRRAGYGVAGILGQFSCEMSGGQRGGFFQAETDWSMLALISPSASMRASSSLQKAELAVPSRRCACTSHLQYGCRTGYRPLHPRAADLLQHGRHFGRFERILRFGLRVGFHRDQRPFKTRVLVFVKMRRSEAGDMYAADLRCRFRVCLSRPRWRRYPASSLPGRRDMRRKLHIGTARVAGEFILPRARQAQCRAFQDCGAVKARRVMNGGANAAEQPQLLIGFRIEWRAAPYLPPSALPQGFAPLR